MSEPSVPADGLLAGLRVIDLSLWQPGQTTTQLLADLGADVIKVEPPGGDRMRPQPDRFANYNGHKRSIALDLKSDDGRRRLLDLAVGAEVVVEGYQPGVAEKLGVHSDALRAVNPALVYCSITGFGQTGELARVAGHDHNYQAFAGAFTFPAGGEPAPAGLLVGDQGSGMAAAFAITAAVLCARRTGEGEHIDLAITDLLASWVAPMGPIDPAAEGETAPGEVVDLPGMGVFHTADGRYVELGVYSEDHLWAELCDALGLPQHRALHMAARTAQAGSLRTAVGAAIALRPRDELVDSLAPRRVPIAPILTRDEMLEHPHFTARGVLASDGDGRRRIGHPMRYAIHPVRPPGPFPALDEHAGEGWGPAPTT